MSDYLVRIMSKCGSLRAMSCLTTDLVGEACTNHQTYPTASAALGRALTGAALMGAMLDQDQRIALRFEGSGPLKKIITEADSTGCVRGFVAEPAVDLPPVGDHLDVGGALGRDGFLTVAKDLRLKEPFRGVVKLYSGEIAEDLAYYFTESEQVPSAVGLGVFVEPAGDVSVSGGFIVQALPGAREDVIEKVIGRIEGMGSLTALFRQGISPEVLLEMVFEDVPFDILEKRDLCLKCSCSRRRIEQAIIALGKEEISRMIDRNEDTTVTCEFCRTVYSFNRGELEAVLKEIA